MTYNEIETAKWAWRSLREDIRRRVRRGHPCAER